MISFWRFHLSCLLPFWRFHWSCFMLPLGGSFTMLHVTILAVSFVMFITILTVSLIVFHVTVWQFHLACYHLAVSFYHASCYHFDGFIYHVSCYDFNGFTLSCHHFDGFIKKKHLHTAVYLASNPSGDRCSAFRFESRQSSFLSIEKKWRMLLVKYGVYSISSGQQAAGKKARPQAASHREQAASRNKPYVSKYQTLRCAF